MAGGARHPESGAASGASALGELGRFACLVEAGLLALDLAGVAGQEALTLEHGAKLRIGLDERPGDPVADRARLTGRAAALHPPAQVVCGLGTGDLQRC